MDTSTPMEDGAPCCCLLLALWPHALLAQLLRRRRKHRSMQNRRNRAALSGSWLVGAVCWETRWRASASTWPDTAGASA